MVQFNSLSMKRIHTTIGAAFLGEAIVDDDVGQVKVSFKLSDEATRYIAGMVKTDFEKNIKKIL